MLRNLRQVVSHPDEVNCNVHEMLAFNDVSRHGDKSLLANGFLTKAAVLAL